MLNILFNPKKAERHYLEMLLVGFFYSSISLLISLWIFSDYASIGMVFLSVFSCLYVVQGALKLEESKEKDYNPESWLLKQHFKILLFLLFLFLGFVLAFSFWSFVLPSSKISVLFEMQKNSVERINQFTGNAVLPSAFFKILSNNIKVLILSIIFALFYGAGAIFVLVWNASVMGFVIGDLARKTFGIVALPLAFTKYFLHGIPEMFAYLIGALVGGILFTAFIKGDLLKKDRAKRILIDSFVLILISIFILIFAAFIEVYISPLV